MQKCKQTAKPQKTALVRADELCAEYWQGRVIRDPDMKMYTPCSSITLLAISRDRSQGCYPWGFANEIPDCLARKIAADSVNLPETAWQSSCARRRHWMCILISQLLLNTDAMANEAGFARVEELSIIMLHLSSNVQISHWIYVCDHMIPNRSSESLQLHRMRSADNISESKEMFIIEDVMGIIWHVVYLVTLKMSDVPW